MILIRRKPGPPTWTPPVIPAASPPATSPLREPSNGREPSSGRDPSGGPALRRSTLLFGLCAGLASALAQAVGLEVEVEGLAGEQRQNVLALLAIYQERGDSNLTEERIEALHARAPGQIRFALSPFGLYQVEIEDRLTAPERPGGPWVAQYRVDPGPPVRIAGVDYAITGPGADHPDFPRRFPMAVGDVVLHQVYEQAKADILAVAAAGGYLDHQLVRHQILIDLEAYNAQVDFHLETGPRFYLGPVHFEQDQFAESFLAGFVDFEPGTPYDPSYLLALQARLLGTEYFDQVEIVPRKDAAGEERIVPIDVVTTPNRPNRFRVGLGYATDEGARFSLDYRRRYIGRYGHWLRSDLTLAEKRQRAMVDYRIPFRDPTQDYYHIQPQFESVDTSARQGELFTVSAAQSVITPGGWRRNIGVSYRYEDATARGDDGSFNGLVPFVSWSRTRSDDPINTRRGLRVRYLIQGTTENSLSETTWLSARASYKLIHSWGEWPRLIARADLGAIAADSLARVPASERFYAGGDNSLRGWSYEGVGPVNPANGRVIGGRYLAVGSLELDQRIHGNWGVAVFSDFGNVYDPDYDSSWEQSAGLGLRYATPIGPVRLDLAYAMTRDPAGFRLHFSLGPDL